MSSLREISIIGLSCLLSFSSAAVAQTVPAQNGQVPQRPDRPAITIYDKLKSDAGGPAPKNDLTGAWAGPIGSASQNVPPMTALGQRMFSLNKPESKYSLAGTNDPFGLCDPLGMPRKLLDQTRGMIFAVMPGRTLQAWQYGSVWRQIWTDGRALPKDVGGTSKDSLDPRWWGYSVGHWEGDYIFVVETTGSDERSWLDKAGHPHSVNMHVEERYIRANHDNLEMDITIDDPKIYTKSFVIAKTTFKWIPNQEFEEQFCVPSEEATYSQLIGKRAGNGSTGNK